MREVLSFRLDELAASQVRREAAARGKRLAAYLEELVVNNLARQLSRPPNLVSVLRTLRHNRALLEEAGVRRAEIFGSVARGEEREDSDVDILVDLDPDIVRDLLDYSCVQQTLEDLIGCRVDIAVHGRARRPEMEAEIARDAVTAY
jgi:predicted nucleotidyltransferase